MARLGAYADGELTGREMLALRRHIHCCPNCAKELEAIRSTKLAVSGLVDVHVPEGLEKRLAERVFRSNQAIHEPRKGPFVFLSLAVATAAAVMAMTFLRDAGSPVADSRSEFERQAVEVARDQAYMERSDPLAGGAGVLPVSYVRN